MLEPKHLPWLVQETLGSPTTRDLLQLRALVVHGQVGVTPKGEVSIRSIERHLVEHCSNEAAERASELEKVCSWEKGGGWGGGHPRTRIL